MVNALFVFDAIRKLDDVAALMSIFDGPDEASNESVPDFIAMDSPENSTPSTRTFAVSLDIVSEPEPI